MSSKLPIAPGIEKNTKEESKEYHRYARPKYNSVCVVSRLIEKNSTVVPLRPLVFCFVLPWCGICWKIRLYRKVCDQGGEIFYRRGVFGVQTLILSLQIPEPRRNVRKFIKGKRILGYGKKHERAHSKKNYDGKKMISIHISYM